MRVGGNGEIGSRLLFLLLAVVVVVVGPPAQQEPAAQGCKIIIIINIISNTIITTCREQRQDKWEEALRDQGKKRKKSMSARLRNGAEEQGVGVVVLPYGGDTVVRGTFATSPAEPGL